MSTGAVVAGAIRRAERRLVEHLRQGGATTPSAAGPLPPMRRLEGRILRRLLASGAVREPELGRYYLDEAAYATYRSGRRRAGLMMGALALAAVAILAWWATRG